MEISNCQDFTKIYFILDSYIDFTSTILGSYDTSCSNQK